MTHPHDRTRSSAPRPPGDVALAALLRVAALSPGGCTPRAERPVATADCRAINLDAAAIGCAGRDQDW